jgi:hypothetical protein
MTEDIEIVLPDTDEIEVKVEKEKPRDPETGKFVKAEPEIEVVDDTPPEDRGKPKRPPGQEPAIPSDEEISKYGEDVQKRIKKIKFEYHTERRRAEESERVREEAIRVAEKLWKENEALKKRSLSGEEVLKDQATKRVSAELAQARAAYRAAFESGNLDELAKAQERMAELSAEKVQVEAYRPVAPPPAPPPQDFIPPPKPDPKALDWAAQNPWFGQDERMTRQAVNLSEQMIRNEGFDPREETYYQELDKRLRRTFPTAFEAPVKEKEHVVQEEGRPQRTIVAPATRAPARQTPRKVTLTASQVNLAQRLGLTVQQYAEQLLEEQRKND